MDTILALPGMVISVAITLAGCAAFLGSHRGPPAGPTPGILTPAAELMAVLEMADRAHRKGTPYASLALARLIRS